MIAVIDYGAGNLRSVSNALRAIEAEHRVTNAPADLSDSSGIVLPGVGAFGDGMSMLRKLGLDDALEEEIIHKQKPFLGICLGLQFLAESSAEHGRQEGLAWLSGTVEPIAPENPGFRVPHMGWNDLTYPRSSPLFEDVPEDAAFYFVHSYKLVPDNPERVVTALAYHGTDITAAIQKDHIFGVQFHPEKSQRDGLTVLRNFLKLL